MTKDELKSLRNIKNKMLLDDVSHAAHNLEYVGMINELLAPYNDALWVNKMLEDGDTLVENCND
tara:strand:- start:12770 stop:12961 length:192 start_codon:yes stop_codon:yes gene_type:complete